ncbi:MAG: tape measure protein [Candidatus Thiodiazotropha taylori]
MDQNLELKITLTGDGRSLSGTVNLAGDEFKDLSKDIDKASKSSDKLDKSLEKTSKKADLTGKAMKKAGAMAAAYFSGQAVLGAIKAADSWDVLQQRIETATKATGDYIMVSEELYRITRENGAAMEGSVSLFQSISRTRKELNASNSDVLVLTDSIQKLGVIGGSSTTAMQAGMMQFSQMMAGGVARAEEMNSLFENLPEVAARIAHGMEMTQGELRQAVLAGEVLSKDVFDALLKQAPTISAEFEEIPTSLSRGWGTLTTSFDHFLGQLNDATGLTGWMAKQMEDVAYWLDVASEAINPTGENLAAQLNQRAIELESAIANASENARGRNSRNLQRWKKELQEINAELEKIELNIWSGGVNGDNGGLEKDLAYLEKFNDLIKEGTKLTESALTPLETYDAQVDHLMELYSVGAINLETLNRLEKQYTESLNDATGVTARLRQEEKDRSKAMDDMLDQYVEEEEAVEESYQAKQKLLIGLREELELLAYSGRELAIQTELRKAHAKGIYDQDAAITQLAGSIYDAKTASEEFNEQAEQMSKAWEEATNRIDETFADAWAGAFDSFEEFADRLEQAFSNLIGELAHQAFTKPILINMGMQGTVGGYGASGYGAQPQGGGGSSLSSTLMDTSTSFAMQSLFASGGGGAAGPVLMNTGGGFMVELPASAASTSGSLLGTGAGALVGYNVAENRGGWQGAVGGVAAGAGTTAILGGASAAAAGGSFGAGAYGALAGMGPVGWIALIAAALYGAFGNSSDADARMVTYRNPEGRDSVRYESTTDEFGELASTSAIEEYTPHNWEENLSVESAFGITGFSNYGTDDIDVRAFEEKLQNMALIDNAIAASYGEEITESITDALDNWYDQTWSADEARVDEMFEARFDIILGELEAAGLDYIDLVKTTGESISEWAHNLATLRAASAIGLEYETMEEASEALAQYTQVSIAFAQLTDLWMTEEEKLNHANQALQEFNDSIERSGNAYIDTREELQAYISSLDLTTEAGRDLAEQALAIAGILDYTLTTTERLAQVESQRLDYTRSNLMSALSNEINELEEQRQVLEDAVTVAHQQYTGALRSSIDAQQQAADEARSTAQDWLNISDSLANAQIDLAGFTSTPGAQSSILRQRYNDSIQLAWQGDQDAMLAIPGLASDYLVSAKREASTSQEYARQVGAVRSQIATAENLAEAQANRHLDIVDAAEQQLSVLQSQLEEAEGLHDDVVSIEQAYKNLQTAEFELASASFDEQIRQHEEMLSYLTGIEQSVDEVGLALIAYINEGGRVPLDGSGQVIPDDFGPYPAYANGGISTGPSTGYPVELHGTEAVIPLPDNRSVPVSFISNSKDSSAYKDLVEEIRLLRAELIKAQEQNRSIGVETIKAVKKTAKVLDRWDVDGQPSERTVA